MKIVHIITGLKEGGAESTLYKICKYDVKNEHIIISFDKFGKYFFLLKKLRVKVYQLNLKYYSIIKFFYLIKLIRSLKPNVVQTWLVHGDLIGGVASKLAGINQIVWNIRYSKLENRVIKLKTFFLIKFLSKLSFIIPKMIIVVSKSALKNCKDLGYCNRKLKLVQNGYKIFILNYKKQKIDYRKKYKIKKNIPILGTVARHDLTKDHQNLLKALSIVRKKNNFRCLLIGSNISKKNKILVNQIKKFELSNYVKLLNNTNNILQSMRSLDIHISSSLTEGFPNVVAEAMTCGTPNIVTNVGDSALIVGKTGWIVPPKNFLKLANTIEKALSEIGKKNWKKRCNQARLRIKSNFGIRKMIRSYNLVWSEVQNKK